MDISRWDWTIWQYPVTTLTEGGGTALSSLLRCCCQHLEPGVTPDVPLCLCVRGRRWQQGGDSPAVIIILEGQ